MGNRTGWLGVAILMLCLDSVNNAHAWGSKPKLKENSSPTEIIDAKLVQNQDGSYYLTGKLIGPTVLFSGIPESVLRRLKQEGQSCWQLSDNKYQADIMMEASTEKDTVFECALNPNPFEGSNGFEDMLIFPKADPTDFKMVVHYNGKDGKVWLDAHPDSVTWRMAPGQRYKQMFGDSTPKENQPPLPRTIKGIALGSDVGKLRKRIGAEKKPFLIDEVRYGGDSITASIGGAGMAFKVAADKLWSIGIVTIPSEKGVDFVGLVKANIKRYGAPARACQIWTQDTHAAYFICANRQNPCDEMCHLGASSPQGCAIWEDADTTMMVSVNYKEALAQNINGTLQCEQPSGSPSLTESDVVLSIVNKSGKVVAQQNAEATATKEKAVGESRQSTFESEDALSSRSLAGLKLGPAPINMKFEILGKYQKYCPTEAHGAERCVEGRFYYRPRGNVTANNSADAVFSVDEKRIWHIASKIPADLKLANLVKGVTARHGAPVKICDGTPIGSAPYKSGVDLSQYPLDPSISHTDVCGFCYAAVLRGDDPSPLDRPDDNAEGRCALWENETTYYVIREFQTFPSHNLNIRAVVAWEALVDKPGRARVVKKWSDAQKKQGEGIEKKKSEAVDDLEVK